MREDERALIERLYQQFNAREMKQVLEKLSEDVLWANGMEGGHVQGRDGVRAYWTRQWAVVDPKVDPVRMAETEDGAIAVEVQQVVRDLEGKVLMDRMVGHLFRLENGLVKRFDIREE